MKRSLYFKTKDDVLEYYGALENIPSTDLVIVEDTGSMYAVSNNASIDGEMTPTGGINWDEVAEYGYIVPAGTYNITENNNYDISSYAYAYVNVEGGGSTYSLVSGYVFDTMGTTLGYMNDNTSYLSYAFTLDSMTPSVSFGEALVVSGNYDVFTSVGLGLGDVEGNGTYTMSGYTPVNDSSGWSEFSISNVLGEQPNVSIDFNVKLYKEQSLYGFPFDIDYTVTGYIPLVISSMTYSLDGGTVYDSMVYDSTNDVYSVTLDNVSVNASGMLSPIVKVEYTNGTEKYLNGNVVLDDYSSPGVYPGYWNTDSTQEMFYIENIGSTDKDIISFIVSQNGNITVNFTDIGSSSSSSSSSGSSEVTGDSWMFSNSDTAGIMSSDSDEQFENPNTGMTETAVAHTFYNIPLNSDYSLGSDNVLVHPFTIYRNGTDELYMSHNIFVSDSDVDNNQWDGIQVASFNPMELSTSPVTITGGIQALPIDCTITVYEVDGGTDYFLRVQINYAS